MARFNIAFLISCKLLKILLEFPGTNPFAYNYEYPDSSKLYFFFFFTLHKSDFAIKCYRMATLVLVQWQLASTILPLLLGAVSSPY